MPSIDCGYGEGLGMCFILARVNEVKRGRRGYHDAIPFNDLGHDDDLAANVHRSTGGTDEYILENRCDSFGPTDHELEGAVD